MKNLLRKSFFVSVLVLFAAIALSQPYSANAADKKTVVKPGKEVSADLDGDGKSETILMTRAESEPSENEVLFTIFINDYIVMKIPKYTDSDMDTRWEFSIVDMVKYNGTRMLSIDGSLYVYRDGGLEKCDNNSGLEFHTFGNYSEKGYFIGYAVSTSLKLSFMCDSDVNVPVRLYISDKGFTTKKTFSFKLDTSYWEGTLDQNIKLYKSRSTKSAAAATLKAGTHVIVSKGYATKQYKVKIDGVSYKLPSVTWIYITADDGTSGWYKPTLESKYTYEDMDGTSLTPYISYTMLFSDGKYAG